MPQIERRAHWPKSLEVRAAGDANKPLTIRGYAAVFYVPGDPTTEYVRSDGVVERIMRGAFDSAIAEDDVRCLNNHEEECVLGRRVPGSDRNTLTIGVDEKGLWYECNLDQTREAIYRSIERGDVTGSSFGFVCESDMMRGRAVWEEVDGVIVRSIYDVTLMDIGPVTFPAYEASTAEARSVSASLAGIPPLLSEVESEDELLLS